MGTYVDNIVFETIVCGKCGIIWGMPERVVRARRDDRATFYCPNGDPRAFNGMSETDRLREEVKRQQQMREAAEARATSVSRQRDEVARAHKRMRTRIMNGVCPCCNRSFQNLLRHMQTEHAGGPTLKALRETYGLTQAALAREIGVHMHQISAHERDKLREGWAKDAIDSWVLRQDTAAPASKETAR